METAQIGNGGWMMTVTEASAPADSFERDIPTMLAMINSRRENQAVCAQIIHANGVAIADNQKRQFDQGQQAHRDLMASFDAHNKAWAAGEVDKSRQNADVVEVIRGERTVLDTTTGEKGSADLGNVNGIVDQLNANEPGRYQQIPLRDELYPR